MNINISNNTRDEIGTLSNDIYSIVNIFSMLISEINHTSEQMYLGDIEARINETKFVGDYKQVAAAINKNYTDLITDTLEFADNVKEYAKGNFKFKAKRFPGKKVIIHENMDLLQKNLKDISVEISLLIEGVSQGDFTVQINAEQYSGDWKVMTHRLNDLLNSVKKPIIEVADVLEEVAKANFNTLIKGEYKGQFKVTKDAVNKTVINTSKYIKDISQILNKMSNQNLDITITKSYIGDFKEIKDALDHIIKTFNRLIYDFSSSSEQVAVCAKQI